MHVHGCNMFYGHRNRSAVCNPARNPSPNPSISVISGDPSFPASLRPSVDRAALVQPRAPARRPLSSLPVRPRRPPSSSRRTFREAALRASPQNSSSLRPPSCSSCSLARSPLFPFLLRISLWIILRCSLVINFGLSCDRDHRCLSAWCAAGFLQSCCLASQSPPSLRRGQQDTNRTRKTRKQAVLSFWPTSKIYESKGGVSPVLEAFNARTGTPTRPLATFTRVFTVGVILKSLRNELMHRRLVPD